MNINLLPFFPWRLVVIAVREEHSMWLTQLVHVCQACNPFEWYGWIPITRRGDCSVTLEFICEARPVWRPTFVDAQTCLQGIKVPWKLYLRCTIADWIRKNHKWTREHSGQQDMQSCELMLKSINCVLKSLEFMSPDATNAIKLHSLLNLVVENLHATTKMKHPAPSLLDHWGDFGKAMREFFYANNKLVLRNAK